MILLADTEAVQDVGGAHHAALLEAEMREVRMPCCGEASPSVLAPLPADPRSLRAVRTMPCCWRLKMHVVLAL